MLFRSQIDELIDEACRLNLNAKTNVYIGAALRHPHTAPFGRAKDEDFFAATTCWGDLDDQSSNTNAKHKFSHCPPSLAVCTGKYPHPRHQVWWRLEEPETRLDELERALRGISCTMNGDPSVTNPSRVMRLAGSIAWDVKEGRVPEVTFIVEMKHPGRSDYHIGEILNAFPEKLDAGPSLFSEKKREAPGPDVGIVKKRNSLGLDTNIVIDGREKHMRNVVCAALLGIIGRTAAVPSVEELFQEAWPAYERTTDFNRSGRGQAEFKMKCRSTLHRFSCGKIKGMRSTEEAIQTYKSKKNPFLKIEDSISPRQNEKSFHDSENWDQSDPLPTFEILDVKAIKSMADPEWLIKGLITDRSMGFLFGAPGCGKSFIAISFGLAIASGQKTWWGRTIERSGPVIYISSEGQSDLKFRIRAWESSNGIKADDAPFYLIRQPINFMAEGDVGTLIRTIQVVSDSTAAPCLVIVDTVSRVLPGADENLQKDMTLFIRACDLVREQFGTTVVGVHHTSRQGNLRGSTVFDGAGDFLAQVEREEGAEVGYLAAKKIKAAEDGWKQAFQLDKIELGLGHSSLYARPLDEPVLSIKKGNGWPDLDTCRRILAMISDAWKKDRALSSYPQTKRQGRYAPAVISSQFGIKAKVAEEMIFQWLTEGVLSVETSHSHDKAKGLKVISQI